MAKLLIRSAALAAAFTVSGSLWAGCGNSYCGSATPIEVTAGSNSVTVQVEEDVPGACDHYWWDFKLNLDGSEASKARYAMLLSAVGQKEKIKIWYTPTEESLRDSDETSGCNGDAMAVITGISIRNSASEFQSDETATDSGEAPEVLDF